MQRVTNCLLQQERHVLLLQKPRRGWWVAPGGKMEPGETVRDAVTREFREETGLFLKQPTLKGIFTFIIKENDAVVSEWMMFTFYARHYEGRTMAQSEEGKLSWVDVAEIPTLPMAEGDRHILDYMLKGNGMMYGAFTYTPDYKLLAYRLDPA